MFTQLLSLGILIITKTRSYCILYKLKIGLHEKFGSSRRECQMLVKIALLINTKMIIPLS